MGERPSAEGEAACPDAMRLLDALWDLFWNGPGSADYGDHSGYTTAEMIALDDAGSDVEAHYLAHGCRPSPPGSGDTTEARS